MSETVLIIEDDQDIASLLEHNLRREGFAPTIATTGKKGVDLALHQAVSLILLDLMLPDTEGLEVCRQLKTREKTRTIPIIMVTAKGEETDIVVGLELGADDYITKPFSIKELIARIHAVLRRAQTAQNPLESHRLESGPLVMDLLRHEVVLHEKPLALTLAEFRILSALLT